MKETIKAWIARTKEGELFAFRTKPVKMKEIICGGYWWPLDKSLFPDITLDNSPKKCEITITVKITKR